MDDCSMVSKVTPNCSPKKVTVILHWYLTFPHLTCPMSTVSAIIAGGAGVVVVVVVGGAPPPGHLGDIPAGQAPAVRGHTCVNPGAQAKAGSGQSQVTGSPEVQSEAHSHWHCMVPL